jgi:hypothetical protein
MMLLLAAALATATTPEAVRDMRVVDPAPHSGNCPDTSLSKLPAGRTFLFDKPLVETLPPSALRGGRTFTFDKPLVKSAPLSTLPADRTVIPLDRRIDGCSAVYPAGVQRR